MKTAVELQSGESATIRVDLGDKLLPGEYEVTVSYFAKSKGLLADAKDDLKSNVVKIRIEK